MWLVLIGLGLMLAALFAIHVFIDWIDELGKSDEDD